MFISLFPAATEEGLVHWRSWVHKSMSSVELIDLCTHLPQWTRPSSVAAGKRLMNTDLHYMGEIDTLWDPVIYDLCTQLLQWTRPSSVAAGKRLMNTDLHYMGEIDTLWDPVIYDLCTQLLQWTRPSSVAAGKRLMKTDLHYMGEMRHSMSSSDLWLVYSAPPVNQAFLSGCREETNEHRPPLHGEMRHKS